MQCNIRGRDIGSFVTEAQALIAQRVKLPKGYRLEWGGQFENMRRAQQRLLIVVPLALGLIVLLLYFTFRNAVDTLFVFASVPFACVGGVLALWTREMPLSISAAVGFITLSGVSVLNSLVLVTALPAQDRAGSALGQHAYQASMDCLRTILMTALVASMGFLPMASSVGTGAEVQRPLATVVIGGVMTSMFMTLFILPVMFASLSVLRRAAVRHARCRAGSVGRVSAPAQPFFPCTGSLGPLARRRTRCPPRPQRFSLPPGVEPAQSSLARRVKSTRILEIACARPNRVGGEPSGEVAEWSKAPVC